MKKKFVTNLLKYGISGILAVGMVFLVLSTQGIWTAESLLERYRILCDAFVVPGLLYILFGTLVWLSGAGAMDGVSWAMQNFVKSMIPGLAKYKEKYQDFVDRRRGKKLRGYGFLFQVGGVFFAVSLVFLVLFMKMDAGM